MPKLVLDKHFISDFHRLPKDVGARVLELPGKFAEATHTGVHLEKLTEAIDPRIRTVRVGGSWRGVVVQAGDGVHILLRVLPHDDAIAWAAKQKMAINQATGVVEIINVGAIAGAVETVVAEDKPETPSLFEHVRDKDFVQLGIAPELVSHLRRLRDEDEVLAIASLMPQAQGDAVLMLADGTSVDEVHARIREEYQAPATPIDPEDVETAFDQPASKADFVVTTTDKELLTILTGDFEAWRTFLHPLQRVVAERPVYNGPFRLTGGAGTGKTVVAMHRARFLARQMVATGDREGKILVATYTTSLASNLERTLKSFCSRDEFERLQISTVDSVANQVVRAAGIRLVPVNSYELRDIADRAVIVAGLDEIGIDGRFLIAEWDQVILGRSIGTLAEYATTPRPGRARRLTRDERKRVWEAAGTLTAELGSTGRATFPQIAARAADVLSAGGQAPFRHAIIDEAQDLHACQWRLLRASVAPGENDLFLVGDAHQRIYDNRVSLASVGIETRGRSRRLKINYRTSQQILGWTLGILMGQDIDDLDGNAERQIGYRSEFQGPPPTTRQFDTAAEEAQYVCDLVEGWRSEGISIGSIGVVGRTHADTAAVKAVFTERGTPWAEIGDGRTGARVNLGTMHSSKGLEFTRLVVAGVSDGKVPLPISVTPEADDAAQHRADILRERCLLYVACTRARDTLVVTSVGSMSHFIPRLKLIRTEASAVDESSTE